MSGYFLILFTKIGTYSQQITTSTQIVKNCKTFSNCIKLGLEVHANIQGCSQNCWIPLRSCKNALKCTKMLNNSRTGVKNIFLKKSLLATCALQGLNRFFFKQIRGRLAVNPNVALIKKLLNGKLQKIMQK